MYLIFLFPRLISSLTRSLPEANTAQVPERPMFCFGLIERMDEHRAYGNCCTFYSSRRDTGISVVHGQRCTLVNSTSSESCSHIIILFICTNMHAWLSSTYTWVYVSRWLYRSSSHICSLRNITQH